MSVSTSRGSEPANTHDARALGQVEQLVHEQLDLVRRDLRPALVDLGLLAGRRVDHGRVRARLLADPDEVAEHGQLRELVDDAGAGRPAGQAGGDHGRAERLEHAGDVDALAARHRRLLDRPVAAAEPEVGHRQGLVDGRVERDGDDHAALVWRGRRRRAEPRAAACASRTVARSTARCDADDQPRALRGRLASSARSSPRARPTARSARPWRRPCRPGGPRPSRAAGRCGSALRRRSARRP